MCKVIVRAPPKRPVTVDEDAPGVHAVGRESVGLIELQPLPGLGLACVRHIGAQFAAPPKPAALVGVKGIIPGSGIPSSRPYCRTATRPSPWLAGFKRNWRVAEIRVPHIPVGKRRKGPASVHWKAISGGELLPNAVFIPYD
jgi:hypothetical protein